MTEAMNNSETLEKPGPHPLDHNPVTTRAGSSDFFHSRLHPTTKTPFEVKPPLFIEDTNIQDLMGQEDLEEIAHDVLEAEKIDRNLRRYEFLTDSARRALEGVGIARRATEALENMSDEQLEGFRQDLAEEMGIKLDAPPSDNATTTPGSIRTGLGLGAAAVVMTLLPACNIPNGVGPGAPIDNPPPTTSTPPTTESPSPTPTETPPRPPKELAPTGDIILLNGEPARSGLYGIEVLYDFIREQPSIGHITRLYQKGRQWLVEINFGANQKGIVSVGTFTLGTENDVFLVSEMEQAYVKSSTRTPEIIPVPKVVAMLRHDMETGKKQYGFLIPFKYEEEQMPPGYLDGFPTRRRNFEIYEKTTPYNDLLVQQMKGEVDTAPDGYGALWYIHVPPALQNN